jgi:pimeloyl-ACP methyl ester carboxylesterase
LLLHYDRATADHPSRWMLFLAGIFGAGRNWATVARRIVRERPEWGAALVDLRQHGGSQGFPRPHTLEAAAGDLRELVAGEQLAAAGVLGHSFGGKVALVYARRAEPGLRQLWVVDSTPDAGPPSGSAWDLLRVLRSLPETFAQRSEGVQAMEAAGLARPLAQWMSTNLVEGEQGWGWRIDPDDMEALLGDFFRTDAWDVVEQPPVDVQIHFVKASESRVLSERACERIEAAGRKTGRVFLHRVSGGHWLNADNPDALVELLVDSLQGSPSRDP